MEIRFLSSINGVAKSSNGIPFRVATRQMDESLPSGDFGNKLSKYNSNRTPLAESPSVWRIIGQGDQMCRAVIALTVSRAFYTNNGGVDDKKKRAPGKKGTNEAIYSLAHFYNTFDSEWFITVNVLAPFFFSRFIIIIVTR